MPVYEYACPACEASYELQQSFSAETTHPCERCGHGTAKRVLHAPRVVFKGSGWYATDSRKSSSAVDDSAASPRPTETKPAETKPAETSSSEPAGAVAK